MSESLLNGGLRLVVEEMAGASALKGCRFGSVAACAFRKADQPGRPCTQSRLEYRIVKTVRAFGAPAPPHFAVWVATCGRAEGFELGGPKWPWIGQEHGETRC